MKRVSVLFALTSPVRGGIEEVVLALARRLDPREFRLALAAPAPLLEAFAPDLKGVAVETLAVEAESWRRHGEVARLSAFIERVRPDIVNAHLFRSTAVAAPLGRWHGARVVETYHGREGWRRGLLGAVRVSRRASAPRRRGQPPRRSRAPGEGSRGGALGPLRRLPRRRPARARRPRRPRPALALRGHAAHGHRGLGHGQARGRHRRRRHTGGDPRGPHRPARAAARTRGALPRAPRRPARSRRRPGDGARGPRLRPRSLRPHAPGRGHRARLSRDGRRGAAEARGVNTLAVVFWAAAALLGYTWVGYPLLLLALRRAAPGDAARRRPVTPHVSVIVAAYNEAGCIVAKLASTLARQRYPHARLAATVVSYRSTDATDALVQRYPDDRVRLVRQEPR